MKKMFGTKVFAVLAALAVLLTFALPKAACAQSVYPDTGDFELRCVYENMPLENMRFSVYRVADMPSLGKFSLLPAFEESGADIENIEKASDWNRVAKELAEFAAHACLSLAVVVGNGWQVFVVNFLREPNCCVLDVRILFAVCFVGGFDGLSKWFQVVE